MAGSYGMNIVDDVSVKTFIISKVRLAIERRISLKYFRPTQAGFGIEVERWGDDMVLQLNAFIPSFQKPITVEVTAHIVRPATWWDFFKETYFPQFLLERFPVVYKDEYATNTKTIYAALCFPELENVKTYHYALLSDRPF